MVAHLRNSNARLEVRCSAELDGGHRLQIFWRKTCSLGDSREHARTKFFLLVKSKNNILPATSLKHAM